MAQRFHTLEVAGIRRELPILNVTDELAIAGFIMLGDVELTDACAKALAEKVPKETEVYTVPKDVDTQKEGMG